MIDAKDTGVPDLRLVECQELRQQLTALRILLAELLERNQILRSRLSSLVPGRDS